MNQEDIKIIQRYMQSRWPKTWRLIEIRQSSLDHRYRLHALGDFCVINTKNTYHDDIDFARMDLFEAHFDQWCNHAANNEWVSDHYRAQYPHIVAYFEIPRMRALPGILWENDNGDEIIIGGKQIDLYDSLLRGGCAKMNLEKFLAVVVKERCCKEIIALLPQPIAEEIVEQF